MRLKRLIPAIAGCAIAVGLYLLNSEAPAPADAATGQLLTDFAVSAPSDPPANFSEAMRAHMEADALRVETLEFFHEPGAVHVPTMTKTEDGAVQVHVWVARPRARLIGTKCEFVRTLQFAIPKSALITATKLVLVNHDTGAVQVLAETDALGRLLQEPEEPPPPSRPLGNLAAAAAGSGCGA